MCSCDDTHACCCSSCSTKYYTVCVAAFRHVSCHVCQETAVWVCSGSGRVEESSSSAALRLVLRVILGQTFPWNSPPAARDESPQRNAHITLQKHKDDLKRPESEEAEQGCGPWPTSAVHIHSGGSAGGGTSTQVNTQQVQVPTSNFCWSTKYML